MNPDLLREDVDDRISDSTGSRLDVNQGCLHGAPVSSCGSRRPGPPYRRRRILAVLGLAFAVFFVWLAFSLGGALTNPALGSSLSSRFSEWARNHGGASIVNWVEKEWYSHHPPPVGGKPPSRSDPGPAHADDIRRFGSGPPATTDCDPIHRATTASR